MTNESSKIFVAKIPLTVTEKALREVFCKYGVIEETKLLYQDDYGPFRGCAFIRYSDDTAAQEACEINGKPVFGKEPIVVRMAEDKRTNQRKKLEAIERQSKQKKKNDRPEEHRMAPVVLTSSAQTPENRHWSYQEKSSMKKPESPWPDPARGPLYVVEPQPAFMYGCDHALPVWTEYRTAEGIPYYHNGLTGLTQWEKPKEMDAYADLMPPQPTMYFSNPASNRIRNVVPNGQHNGQKELKLNNNIHLDKDFGNDNRQLMKNNNEPDEGRYGPFGCNLFVFHLPDEWGDDDLYESFTCFGNIVSAKVMRETATQRSRGFGFVSFDCREAATLAIKKMQGFKAGKKRLKVEFKKGESPVSILNQPDNALGNEEHLRRRIPFTPPKMHSSMMMTPFISPRNAGNLTAVY